MACDLVFNINGEEYTFKNTTLEKNSSLQDISLFIVNNPTIALRLKEKLKDVKHSEVPTYISSMKPVANYTVKVLLSKYPYKNWNIDDLGIPVLAVNKYQLKSNSGNYISGPRILSDGTILVNMNLESDIEIVYAYLNRKRKLENPNERVKVVLEKYRFIEELFENYKKSLKKNSKSDLKEVNSKLEDILLDFILNSDAYKEIFTSDNKSLFTILKWAMNEIDDVPIKDYGDTFTDEINSRINWEDGKCYILVSDLKQLLKQLFNSGEFLSDKNITNELALNILRELYFSNTTIDFPYLPLKIQLSRVYLKNEIKSFGNRYPDFIKQFHNITEVESMKGYHIYEWKTEKGSKYIYSKGILTEASYAVRMYPDIRSIRKILSDKLYNNMDSFYEIHMGNSGIFYTPYSYPNGTIIEVLDSSSLNLSEIDRGNVSDLFYNLDTTYDKIEKYLLNTYNIPKGTFDTTEKMLLFLHAKLLYNTNTEDLIDKINNLPKKYYYIENTKLNSSKYGNNYYKYVGKDKVIAQLYQVRAFEIDMDSELDLYKPKYIGNQALVTRNILKNLATILLDKFGVPIEVLTADEIADKFPDEHFETTAKAFIRNGIIYINSSKATSEDVYHEYAHIFLGVLKAKNYELYAKLMDSMNDLAKKKEIKLLYPNLANQDVNEEVFAFYLGRHLANSKVPRNLESNLEKAKKSIEKNIQSIFNANISGDALFNGDIWKTTREFTSNMLLLVEENKDFLIDSELASNRKAANWIAKLISEENLIENCI